MEHVVRIKKIESVTHDVKRLECERPPGYEFVPGQATDVAINRTGWQDEKRPFTFTALSDSPFLEFVIKTYPEHAGVTAEIAKLSPNDELIIDDAWGAIEYKGSGYFIAGGAGITPFIAILRQLKEQGALEGNKLLFSNKTDEDVILEEELTGMLGANAVYTITNDEGTKHHRGMIDEQFLKENIDDFSKHFYLCGPPKMVEALTDCLTKLGAKPEAVVFEK